MNFPADSHCALFFSVCGSKLVAAIRAALVKGRSTGDAALAAANETARELEERICQLHRSQKQSSAKGGGTGMSPARVITAWPLLWSDHPYSRSTFTPLDVLFGSSAF